MIVEVSGRGLAFELSWPLCALLRDNIQHHCESGLPSGLYPAIHRLGDRCWAGSKTNLAAARLRRELDATWTRIRDVPRAKLAVSPRTRAAFSGALSPPPVRATVLLVNTDWNLPVSLGDALTVGDVLTTVVFKLYELCWRSDDGLLHLDGLRSGIWDPIC